MTNTKLSKLFITGFDKNTVWMKDWFIDNFNKHNPGAELKVYNFDINFTNQMGWFKKPEAMLAATKLAHKVCWIDLDCEVVGNIEDIFDFTVPNKLGMVEDAPWSQRNGTTWHNSGVVCFEDNALPIINKWRGACVRTNLRGDQEVLHDLMKDPLTRLTNIESLPNRYNVLRIQHIDNTVPKNPLVYHWTGIKGKDHIRKLING
jgi:hypothetical protein